MRVKAAEVLTNAGLMADVVKSLKGGEVIAYPTDTVYGLGCDAYNAQAIDKLFQLKKRPRKQPVSILCCDLMDMHRQAVIPGFAYEIIKKLLPGPYTFILPLKNPKLKPLLGDSQTVAIRMPKHVLCLEMAKNLGSPIVTTSVNFSDEPPMQSAEQIERIFSLQLAYLIDEGPLGDEPSSLIDLTHDVPRILREGKGDVAMFL